VAQDVGVGSRVELKATNALGVPLHRQARPSLFGRAADGTIGTVIELQNQDRWLSLTLPDGRTGWIVSGYVSRVLPPDPPPPNPANDVWEVWSSAERCETVVRAGRRNGRGAAERHTGRHLEHPVVSRWRCDPVSPVATSDRSPVVGVRHQVDERRSAAGRQVSKDRRVGVCCPTYMFGKVGVERRELAQ
jgi:hypothetical protein